MCCGPRVAVQSQTYQPSQGGAIVASMPGAEGLVLVKYLGKNFGNQTYYGPATGAAYLVSAKKNTRWVDPKDLHFETSGGKPIGLFDLIDKSGKKLFQLARQPVKDKIAEATEIAETMKPSEIESAEKVLVIEDTTKMIVPVESDYFVFVKGIGKATSQKLVAEGYYSTEQLLDADSEDLKETFGWSETKVQDILKQLEELYLEKQVKASEPTV
jgi:hypothetical protein